MACLTLSASGWVNNIILYLITEFNFKIIDAAKSFNVISGCMALFPILGAVIADSFIGCFSVIWISSIINLLVIMLNPLFTFHHETSRSAAIVAATVVIYVRDDVSWAWGFGICVAANVLAIAKRKLLLSDKTQDFYSENSDDAGKEPVAAAPTESFKFLNPAALLTQSATEEDGSIKKSWKLCTVQQSSLTVIPALTMDRHFGPNFKIPPASIMVFTLLSAISLPLIDRLSDPIWQKISIPPLTLLQKIGIGHVLTILSMAISALVESTRLRLSKAHNLHSTVPMVPMSVFWLIPQLILVGIVEALSFPAQASLFYQEFPASLKSTSTAMAAMLVGMAFYLSAALIDLFRRVTNWLPDNINQGRLDNVYWMLVAIGGVNFVYYLVCTWFYKSNQPEEE
ncbi:protein NRT1/ PTR FAMILY 2.6-like [Coffea eugenioides]|uniref:protein NRT1/ PTR FAMILY 2.6-like n=2 Tax=Coffea eugenioides TaxID=49369 RepID=UPI000F61138C|nr:protein NRT1/ PTR FAMILY 2.6-like [Coffea eugenioides]